MNRQNQPRVDAETVDLVSETGQHARGLFADLHEPGTPGGFDETPDVVRPIGRMNDRVAEREMLLHLGAEGDVAVGVAEIGKLLLDRSRIGD